MDVNLWWKLGLAFAVGVSLSAGYVVMGQQLGGGAPAVVVVQERCAELDEGANDTPSWRLGQSRVGAVPLREGVELALQREGLFLGAQRLLRAPGGELEASAVKGHRIVALDQRLQEQASTGSHANLHMDPDGRVRDLVDVLYTLGRNGFGSYQLVVADATLGLLISPPQFAAGELGAEAARLVVELRKDGVHVGRQLVGQTPESIARLPWDDHTMVELERIAGELAGELNRAEPEQRTVALFSAEPQLPISSLLEAMSAASGRGCDAAALDRGASGSCSFVERVIHSGPPVVYEGDHAY